MGFRYRQRRPDYQASVAHPRHQQPRDSQRRLVAIYDAQIEKVAELTPYAFGHLELSGRPLAHAVFVDAERVAERRGARVFNKPSAIRDHNEKLAIAQFSEFTSPTLVSSDSARLRAFHAKHGDVIFKPLDGMLDKLVEREIDMISQIGVPLPLISYGGTSLVTICLGLGILMSIQTHKKLVQS